MSMKTIDQHTKFLPGTVRATALIGGLAALVTGCDSGARVNATGVTVDEPDIIVPLVVDYDLRQDLFFGDGPVGFLGDMVAADIDGDGDTDVVQTNFADFDITVAFGVGNGSFPIRETFQVRGAPQKVVLGDFDADGDTDIAVACKKQEFDIDVPGEPEDGIQIFLQGEEGVFTDTAFRALDSNPFDLVAAPVSGGPADELLVTLPFERTTHWLGLNGTTLQLVEDLPSFANGRFGLPLTVAAIDVTGDGLLDVLVGDFQVEETGIGRVLAHRSFPDVAENVLLPSAAFGDVGPEVIDFVGLPLLQVPLVKNLGDVNGDGLADAGIADLTSGQICIFSRDTEIMRVDEVDFGGDILSFTAADFDGDEAIDLGATLLNEGSVAVSRGLAAGGFGPASYLSVGYLPRALQAVDLDSDDRMDLVTCNASDMSFLRGVTRPDPASEVEDAVKPDYKTAHGYLARSSEQDPDLVIEPAAVAAHDLDGDDLADVVAIDRFQRVVVFMRGDGHGALEYVGQTQLSDSDVETPGYLLLRDFDGDGDQDLVTSAVQTDELVYLRNDGTMPFPVVSRIPVGQNPRGLSAADVDGDGNLDVLVANHDDSSIQVSLGDGAGAFTPQTAIDVGFKSLALAAIDLDGDEDIDIAVTTGDGADKDAYLRILENVDGEFVLLEERHELGAHAYVIACGDLDGDELCDLVVSQGGEIADEVFVFRNGAADNGLSFTSQKLTVGLNPGTLILTDVDRDTNLDLIVPLGRGEVRVALGNGEGQFPDIDVLPADVRGLSSPFGTIASAYADLDGDELDDLILVSWRTPHVWVARNLSVPVSVDE